MLADVPQNSPAPPRLPRRVLGAHSGGEQRASPARPLQNQVRLTAHPHEQRSPSTREWSPRRASAAPLGPHSPPCPGTYVTAEGNGSSDEGPISKDRKSVRVKASRQPAAIFAIEDRSGEVMPPLQRGLRNFLLFVLLLFFLMNNFRGKIMSDRLFNRMLTEIHLQKQTYTFWDRPRNARCWGGGQDFRCFSLAYLLT